MPQHHQAEIIGIDPTRGGLDYAGVHLGEFNDFRIGELQLPHQLEMPVAGPALVHNLRLHLRPEIEHFGAQHVENLALPFLKVQAARGDEADDILHPAVTFTEAARMARAGRERIDMLLDGDASVKEPLDLISPVFLAEPVDPVGEDRHPLDHAPVGSAEHGVVLEEITVPEHMRHNQLVLQQRIAVQQEGVAGVGVNDELIDFAQAMVIFRFHPVIGLAEAPVREPCRHPVGADRVEHLGRAHLVAHREKIQPVLQRQGSQLLHRLLQLQHFIVQQHRLTSRLDKP
ncbi:hypothetical protein D3C75_719640 [compost metagenome]